jgi:hypothetical protein
MMKNIEFASENYKKSVKAASDVFAAAGRQFVEPQGVADHIRKARELYGAGDEAAAVSEVQNATGWLNGIVRKFLRGGIEFFQGRITELSYMSLDRDIMERMEARMRDYTVALQTEDGERYDQRIKAYVDLAEAVNGARDEQARRNENRERRAHEEVQRREQERETRRRENEQQLAAEARRRQEESEAAARAKRETQFDELFSTSQ